ncbi:unnamed protein product [Pieris macdunnoughi]|uniref:Uncharacterized protein n=1 Tax=Pieris macdunnoughi TaxID=345717 RepID=A0A821QKZ2_9NEOP|nr:unnamed protein product [Pieris macdunnoughi]
MEKTTPIVAAKAGIISNGPKRFGRGAPEIPTAYKNDNICFCSREKAIVFCRACGFYCHGRIRIRCKQHPRVSFLLDITECPRCHSSVFLEEHCAS